jgi:general secretion pathway protein C
MSDDGQNTPPGQNPGNEKTHPGNEPTLIPATPAEPVAHEAGALPSFMGDNASPGGPDGPRDPRPKWKIQAHAWMERMKQSQWLKRLGERIQNFEPAQTAEWASKTFQRQDAGGYGKAATIALCAFFLADLAALLLGRFIPEPPVARLSHPMGSARHAKTLEDYNVIFARNLFNRDGKIPGEETPGGPPSDDAAPVKTSLPFNLIGTLILQDELRSIATIEDKSASMVYPVRATDEIPSKARILKVEPRKVTFINVANGRKEYLDMPEDGNLPPVNGPRVSVAPSRGGGPGIEKVAENQFNVSRSEVDNALKDLNKVLTEARAVPNFENGVANGYKLFQIVPGSIYDKLGLQNGDVISGLNGTPINDPGKAFEMLSEL